MMHGKLEFIYIVKPLKKSTEWSLLYFMAIKVTSVFMLHYYSPVVSDNFFPLCT